jgi:hypothetical protein
MIVKWVDEQGTSLFDYVVHISKLNNEDVVKVTQATLDHKLVSRDFDHGYLEVLTDKGEVLSMYDLGPIPNTYQDDRERLAS